MRHRQGTALVDWAALTGDGQERGVGTSVFVFAPTAASTRSSASEAVTGALQKLRPLSTNGLQVSVWLTDRGCMNTNTILILAVLLIVMIPYVMRRRVRQGREGTF